MRHIIILAMLLLPVAGPRLDAAHGQETAESATGGQPASEMQPGTPSTSQPATQPATAPVNPLRSPYDSMQFFLHTVRDPDRDEARYAEAMVCLDFGAMDPEQLKDAGPHYVKKLDEILRRLEAEGHFDPKDKTVLPDEPTVGTGKLQSFGRNPIVMVLERIPRVERDAATGTERTVQEWRLSASTVVEIPKWHANLDGLIERMEVPQSGPAVPTEGVAPASLSSPYHTTTSFLDSAKAAQDDGEYYAAAFACLDFSEAVGEALGQELKLEDPAAVDAELKRRGPEYVEKFVTEHGITYVDGLARVIRALRDAGVLRLDDLPQTVPPEHKGFWAIGGKPLELILIRQADGQWRFGAATVRNVPQMVEELKRRGGAALAPGPLDAAPTAAPPVTPIDAGVRPPRSASRARKQFRSAQATLGTFRKAMRRSDLNTAVSCLDLSLLSTTERELAYVLAGKLWLVMFRTEKAPLSTVPHDPDGESHELLARPEGRIEIDRQWGKGREDEWLFTTRTVRDIEDLYQALESEPIHADWKAERLSFLTLPSLYVREFVNTRINDQTVERTDPITGEIIKETRRGPWPKWLGNQPGGLRVWQWLGVLLVLLLGLLVRLLSQLLLPLVGRRLLHTEQAGVMPQALRRALRPTSTLAMVAAWWGGLQLLDLGSTIMGWTWLFLRIVMVVVAVGAFYRLIDLVMSYFATRAARTASKLDDVLVPLVQKTLKVVVVAIGLVFVAKALGFQITPLLAGLGVGGLAFGLAAQDTLKNFFGSVNVVLDRPFQVGDWVKVGDAEGTVESVGLRSSRVRTFYNSQLTIPNSEIMNTVVDNLGRRRYRRTSTAISVTYSTSPEQLEAFCEGIREIIRRHPFTRKDYFHVYVKAFAASSIDIMLYCFHECPDWGIELRERHRLYLDIVRLANRLGVGFAFPTQTLHVHQENETPDAQGPPVPTNPEEAVKFGREQAEAILAQMSEQNR